MKLSTEEGSGRRERKGRGNKSQFILQSQDYTDSKPNKDITPKEYYRTRSLMDIDADFVNKILTNQIQQQIKRTKCDLSQE